MALPVEEVASGITGAIRDGCPGDSLEKFLHFVSAERWVRPHDTESDGGMKALLNAAALDDQLLRRFRGSII